MFKDDRMISILTAILLMVLVGTVIQRADGLSGLLGDGAPEPEPVASAAPVVALTHDAVSIPAEALARIDVMSNDPGLSAQDRASLRVIQVPACGRVFVQAQALQYLSDASCVGRQTLSYGVTVAGVELVADVQIDVIGKPGAPAPPKPAQPVAQADNAPARAEPEPHRERAAAPTVQTPADTTEVAAATPEAEPRKRRRKPRIIYSNAPTRPPEPVDPAAPALRDSSDVGGSTLEAASTTGTARADQPTPTAAPAAPVEDGMATLQERLDRSQPDPVHVSALPGLAPAAPADNQAQLQLAERAAPVQRTDGQGPRALPAPANAGEGDAGFSDFLVALVELREPDTTPPTSLSADALAGARMSAGTVISESGTAVQILAYAPQGALAGPAGPGTALRDTPVDPTQAPFIATNRSVDPLARPVLSEDAVASPAAEDDADVQVARLDPSQTGGRPRAPEAPLQAPVPAVKRDTPEAAPNANAEPAALPAAEACETPPSTTLDVRRAGQTYVGVIAPCHAGTVAELQYSGLKFAITLDGKGHGQLLALGFEPNAPALLVFHNGQSVDFDLPFKGMNKVSRVALVWDLPVTLELNALEFGAPTGASGHVSPQNPRSFAEVRREGGGFLTSYRSAYGTGQNAEIYTHYRRRGGESGIVKMLIDFASRNRDRLEGTCGSGNYAAPQFMVVRSDRGRLERPVIRKLAALDCSRITEEIGDKRLISSAVADLIITRN